MVDVAELGSSLTLGFTGILPQIMKYVGYLIWGVIILGGMWAVYVFTQYKYKYMYAVAGPGGIRRLKKDRIRPVKHKGADKWQLLWGKDKIEPFDQKYVYPGNIVFGYRVEKDCHVPAMWIEMTSSIDIIPRDVKFWQSTEIQQAALEYQDLRTRMLPILTTLGTVIFCLIACIATVWIISKTLGGGFETTANQLSALQEVARNVAPR